MYYGGIEAGGTKFVCAVSDSNLNIIEKQSFKTESPEITIPKIISFFSKYSIKSIGIGSFGPIEINKSSEKYGYITSTPKKNWENFDFVGSIQSQFNVPIGWTTDVNAAALGEFHLGAGKDKSSCLYLTIGTGIGGGFITDGHIHNGIGHSEMGHIPVFNTNDNYSGNCLYHRNCLEGMASGPAIEKRLGTEASLLNPNDPFWKIESNYIAQALLSYSLILRPEIIVLGGGVMHQKHLFDLIKNDFITLMNGYLEIPEINEYIVPCGLNDNSGIMGCFLLAKNN